jgi:hypothetical protein
MSPGRGGAGQLCPFEQQRVDCHEQARPGHGQRRDLGAQRQAGPGEGAGGEGQRDRVVADRPAEVLAHLAQRGPADPQRERDVERVGAHQHDVGGLDRHVGAGPDRDPDIGGGQRRRVVDPVADHRHAGTLRLQPAHLGRLVPGKHLGDDGVDAEFAGDPLRGGGVVPGEHDDPGAESVQFLDREAGRRAGRVGDREQPGHRTVDGHRDDRVAARGELVVWRGEIGQVDALPFQQPAGADRDPPALNGCEHPVPGHGGEPFGGHPPRTGGLRVGHDGLGERMLGLPLHRGGDRDDVGFRVARGDHDGDDLGFALGQGAGLVHHDGVDAGGGLDRGGVLDQYPAAGTQPGAHHDRGRGGQTEGVRAGDDHDGDREQQGRLGAAIGEQHPRRERGQPAGKGDQDQPERGPVGQPLAGRLGVLRLLHQPHDLGQRGVGADPGGAHPQRAVAVDGGADHRCPRLLVHRQALAGHHRLIDLGLAVLHHAVHRHLRAGAHQQQFADRDLRGGHLDRFAAAQHHRLGRGQVEQRVDRVVRAAAGAHLEPVTEQHERDQHRRRLVEHLTAAGDGHAQRVQPPRADRDRDQHHHVQRPGPQRPPRAGEEDHRGVAEDRQA